MDDKERTARTTLSWITVAVVAVGLGWPVAAQAEDGETTTLKVASLAPENSSWAKAFERMGREIAKKTDGAVELKLYPGGVMGDEPAMVRKMRTGQLDGAAVTNVGLGQIEKKVLILQLPLLFKNWDEVDYVRDKMSSTFEGMLDEAGFTLLTWGDVGFNYVFSKQKIQTPDDIKGTKAWVWESDPIMNAIMDVANVNAVPLAVTDVLPSLSTGVIDTFTNSPYGAVSLQWYTRAEYVTNLKLSVVVGGLVMTNESMEKLSDEHREIVKSVADEQGQKMLTQIREDNRAAIGTIQEAGVEVVPPEKMSKWKSIAEKTREALTGELYPKSLIEKIEKHLEEFRD